MIKFLFKFTPTQVKKEISLTKKQSIPLGLIAGFADATGGGGWGPIATPVLLSKKGMSPRKVVGTVDTSEFAIAVSATLGFLISLGWQDVNWLWVGALMIGGIIAAPIAAWIVQKIHGQLMGVLVGGFIILINSRTLVTSWIDNTAVYPYIYIGIFVIWIIAISHTVSKIRSISSKVKNQLSLD
ncbi:putative membrane protein YfcA [Metabacillus crassostreae]|nr:putative membrane protein YfcA [Metabacillus crassostreae]